MVLNDWPLSKCNSLQRKMHYACVVTLHVTWGHGQRLAELIFFSKLKSNVELEVKKKKKKINGVLLPTHPSSSPLIYHLDLGVKEERKDLWGVEKGRRMDLRSIGAFWTWEVKWEETHPTKEWLPAHPRASISPTWASLWWKQTEKRHKSMWIQIQSRTSQDVWFSSWPRYMKSAEGPPSAGRQQKMQNQEAWEWLFGFLKYLRG